MIIIFVITLAIEYLLWSAYQRTHPAFPPKRAARAEMPPVPQHVLRLYRY